MIRPRTILAYFSIALVLAFSHARSRAAEPSTPLAKPRYGAGLTETEALAGWIALFDGQTDFGWTGAKLGAGSSGATLEAGRSTSELANYELRANVSRPGAIILSGEPHQVSAGSVLLTSRGKRGPFEFSGGVAVTALALKPLEMQSLFNGRDLRGWDRRDSATVKEEKRARWWVEDGVIQVRSGSGALEYAPKDAPNLFGDFIAQVVVRTRKKDTNGGFFIRNEPGRTIMGYEAQLHNTWYDHSAGEHGYTTGGIDDRQQARTAVAVDETPFCMTVFADGPHIATWVNGHQTADWTDRRPPHANPRNGRRLEPGTLQLQAHDPETDLEFHAVRIAPLPSK